MFKKSQGNNKIRRIWRKFQIKRFGVKRWCQMFNRCNRNQNCKAEWVKAEDANLI